LSNDTSEQRFRRLYEQHYEALFAYAIRRCANPSDAHDVVADTFVVLWRRFDDAPDDAEVPLWLYGVARHVLANRHRAKLRKERLVARLGELMNETSDTEEIAALRERSQTVVRALKRLAEDDREVLLLAAWEQLATSEIAAVLHCSENAAAIRLHRARKRLTEVYKKENERSGDRHSEWPRLRRLPEEGQDT
jgi:RNA polymerase sigma factor (sigma-70 family)